MFKEHKQFFIKKVQTVDKYKKFRYFVLSIKQYKNGNFSKSLKGFMNFEAAKRYKLLMLLNKKVVDCDIIFNDIYF